MNKACEKLNNELTDLTVQFSVTAVMLMRESELITELEKAICRINRYIANMMATVAVELDMADSADRYFDHCEATIVVDAEQQANAVRAVRCHIVPAPDTVQ